MNPFSTLVAAITILAGCAGHFDAASATGFQTITRKDGVYWAYVPNDAVKREQRGELMPVLVYLHDASARGDDPEQATQDGLGAIVEKTQGAYPLVVLFPQLARGKSWTDPLELAKLDHLIDDALHRIGGDPDRLYLTGVGLGGTGAWRLAAENPGRFAALVPIAAAAGAELAPALGALPVWSMSADREDDAGALDVLGKKAKHTTVPRGRGSVAARAYATPGLVEWLLLQRRLTAAPAPAGR